MRQWNGKNYSGGESGSFVNGILGNVAKLKLTDRAVRLIRTDKGGLVDKTAFERRRMFGEIHGRIVKQQL